MGFFTAKHKSMARNNSMEDLQKGYKSSEYALRVASYKGDKKALKEAMKVHGNFEYAMLYRNTPEFNKNRK
ncbi:MAG: hypothetical protein IJA61_04730 [Clostridia bacterium]|nr:hypothetical protein [Clostridia bacterium]